MRLRISIIISCLLLTCNETGSFILRKGGLLSPRSRWKFKVQASSVEDMRATAKDKNNVKKATTVFSQACLVAGTTIGGGFLALPTATAPLGALPATIGLSGTWIYLLGCALSLSDSFYMLLRSDNTSRGNGEEGLSIFTISKACFGNIAGVVSSALFLTLVYATLIAQLSKMGTILHGVFPAMSAFSGTVAFSTILGAVCLLGSARKVERMNDFLTGTMLLSFLSLVGIARTSPNWSPAGLSRADYRPLLPPAAGATSPWAVPVFIQLLLYSEVVPLIASRLQDQRKTGLAIVGGSAVPLFMTLTWTYIALALVPFSPAASTSTAAAAAAAAAAAKSVLYDPLAQLTGRGILASVNTLAVSAICTTAVGSVMATTNLLEDVASSLPWSSRADKRIDCDATVPPNIECVVSTPDSNDTGGGSSTSSGGGGSSSVARGRPLSGAARRLLLLLVAIGPAAVVAAIGSPDLYFYATAFAGEVPCTLLYGLLPPLCNLRLRWLQNKRSRGRLAPLAVLMQVLLAAVSVAIVAGTSLKRAM
jgi:amino acid permease